MSFAHIKGILVQEEDGSPIALAVRLKVTNNMLTDNGDGSVSIDLGGPLAATSIKATYFATISSGTTSGTITKPAGGTATLIMDEWGTATDAILSTMENGKPTFISPRDASGNVITTTFDTSGNYTFSATPSPAADHALIYVYTATLNNFLVSESLFEGELVPATLPKLSVTGEVILGGTTANGLLTLYQKADSKGICIYGYDDQVGAYTQLHMDSSGRAVLNSYRAAGGIIYFNIDGSIVVFVSSGGIGLTDDKAINFGSGTDYKLRYNSTDTQIELWSNDIDGGGSDAVVFAIKDGANEIDFKGGYGGLEQAADPPDPAEGHHTIWQSNGTGSGDDGDIMIKITAGGSTKTITLVDFSAF